MNESRPVVDRISESGVVSILVVDDAEQGVRAAEALLKGGLPVVEVTFRTEAAAAAIRRIARELPEALVGAGTILTIENLVAARDAGAQFVVTPGLNQSIVRTSQDIELPVFPGVMTPGEIEHGLNLGLELLKFFPAEQAGGVAMLKALSGPYAHTGVRFIPTGGVGEKNLGEYLKLPIVAACGGTWVASKELVSTGNWKKIEENAQASVELIRLARTGLSH